MTGGRHDAALRWRRRRGAVFVAGMLGRRASARGLRGRALAARHRCGVCHNPDFSGREQMPRLANQREDYLLKAMRGFASGRRIGYGAAMTQELAGLPDEALVDLAHFLAHFGSERADSPDRIP